MVQIVVKNKIEYISNENKIEYISNENKINIFFFIHTYKKSCCEIILINILKLVVMK